MIFYITNVVLFRNDKNEPNEEKEEQSWWDKIRSQEWFIFNNRPIRKWKR